LFGEVVPDDDLRLASLARLLSRDDGGGVFKRRRRRGSGFFSSYIWFWFLFRSVAQRWT
jgi:hypothetical protein